MVPMPGLMVELSVYLSFSLVPGPASDVTYQLFVIVLTQWRRHVGRVCLIKASHGYVTHTHWKILWTGSTWRTSTEKQNQVDFLAQKTHHIFFKILLPVLHKKYSAKQGIQYKNSWNIASWKSPYQEDFWPWSDLGLCPAVDPRMYGPLLVSTCSWW